MIDSSPPSSSRERAYWLALRGAQQMDLAERFIVAASVKDVRVLALKGVSLAEELYGGHAHRAMADVDLLVVDHCRFPDAAQLAREIGLVEIGGSDHDLAFKEPRSGVLLELHLSLTACPGLFPVDHQSLWTRRAPVPGSHFFRLGDVDLVIHLALHAAFQHGFAAGPGHFEDFARAVDQLQPSLEEVVIRARELGGLSALSAMARASSQMHPGSDRLAELSCVTAAAFPRGLTRLVDGLKDHPAPFSVASLARVRYELAPSKWRWLEQSLLPASVPGQTLPRRGRLARLIGLLEAGMGPAVGSEARRS